VDQADGADLRVVMARLRVACKRAHARLLAEQQIFTLTAQPPRTCFLRLASTVR